MSRKTTRSHASPRHLARLVADVDHDQIGVVRSRRRGATARVGFVVGLRRVTPPPPAASAAREIRPVFSRLLGARDELAPRRVRGTARARAASSDRAARARRLLRLLRRSSYCWAAARRRVAAALARRRRRRASCQTICLAASTTSLPLRSGSASDRVSVACSARCWPCGAGQRRRLQQSKWQPAGQPPKVDGRAARARPSRLRGTGGRP